MESIGFRRVAGLAAVAGFAVLAGGCAVYATPSGEVVGAVPVVVAPPPAIVINPFGFYGGHRNYHGPRYYGRGYYGGPRYYGRPYYRAR